MAELSPLWVIGIGVIERFAADVDPLRLGRPHGF